ncbi:Methylenetetrahydrofolate reductase [Mycena venus]|uniref:Methylenetetrahydrofolate reductase n=1 Tax=Mycena venus TaxID=2733690 RepID=A0A8H6YDL9_9AGAR|nr:Methylenetetrahydrofolate reductase [Mycena venus]
MRYPSGSGLPSGLSAGSLDLGLCLHDDLLLSESLTLSSLSSSTSSTPPIPAGCMVPLATIIDHNDGPTMSRRCSLRKFALDKATLTSPTPPRLRTMLKEKLLVETWLNGVAFDSSEHTPWSGIDNAEPTTWKSEGSLYNPQVFKTKMALARRNRELKEQRTTPSISGTAPPATFRHRSSNRNALVFEREIILNSGGQSTRMSLRASAKTMDPGVAEMISELQNLNSFFKEKEAKAPERPIAPPPPSLIVSNSHFSLPVSLESSGNLTPNIPLALAARRGKKMLPPLSVKPSPDEHEYPSMPTAFLGSPSTYSPKFEFASHPNRPSMDLQQMVTSLRSQCAPLDPAQEAEEEEEDDEWAFADGLLDPYSPRPFDSEFVKKPLLPDMVDYAAESLTDSPAFSSRGPVEAIPHSPSPSTRATLNAPPSTPLPPRPAQRTSVRSILKSTKSVRFASLPHERPESPESPVIVTPRPRRSLPSSPPSKRPLPPRPRSHTVRPTIPAPLYRSPAPKPMPTFARGPDQRGATIPGAASHHMASPARPSASPERPSAAPTRSPPKKSHSSGRHSLSRVFSTGTGAKENKPSSPNPPTTPTSSRARWTLNENVLRRASIAVTETQTPTQKNRMPVPLRNILTRFK